MTACELTRQEPEELSRRLIDAQEQERKHIAQEIHDDLSQRFAVTLMGMRALHRTKTRWQRRSLIDELIGEFEQLESDLQALSHRLYSPTLTIVGLVPNVISLCTEVSRNSGLEIVCDHAGIPNNLSEQTVLALFRVAQEALRNVVKHSGASKVQVTLTGTDAHISLAVLDNGIGLGLEARDAAHGLGLHSMRERVRTLGGFFAIATRPSIDGTRIGAIVPTRIMESNEVTGTEPRT